MLLYRDPKQLCVGGQPGNPNGQAYIESWHKTLRARLRIQFDAAALFSTFVNVYSLILRLRVQQARPQHPQRDAHLRLVAWRIKQPEYLRDEQQGFS